MGRVWETAEIRVWETTETRPCHLASAARTAAAGADPHAGKALATEGYRWVQASRRRGLGAEKSPKNGSRALSEQRASMKVYTFIYPQTPSALLHDCLTKLEPGTRSRISARCMAPGRETPRARRGGAPRAGGRRPRLSGDVCVEGLRLEGSSETRGVPVLGAGPSENGTCIGKKSRAGRRAVFFFVREEQSLYNASQSAPS